MSFQRNLTKILTEAKETTQGRSLPEDDLIQNHLDDIPDHCHHTNDQDQSLHVGIPVRSLPESTLVQDPLDGVPTRNLPENDLVLRLQDVIQDLVHLDGVLALQEDVPVVQNAAFPHGIHHPVGEVRQLEILSVINPLEDNDLRRVLCLTPRRNL